MTEYQVVTLMYCLEKFGESKTEALLSLFSCPFNQEIENYLKHSAINLAKQNISPTYLVFALHNDTRILCGYFTISLGIIVPNREYVSNTVYKKLKKFGTPNEENCSVPLPLIAQLGKNFSDEANELISGKYLLNVACDKIKQAQAILGGKYTYLECEDKPVLLKFYEDNGFVAFGKRKVSPDDNVDTEFLVQMLKILK